jgi:crossover junction endodeoxyribonuclease RuvC
MTRKILAIDPGSVSAAYAILDEATLAIVDVDDVPVVDKMVDAAGWTQIVEFWEPHLAIIEQVSAMPKQGVSSTFKFGMGCGLLRGVVIANGVPVIQVTPTKWKRDMGLDSDGEKSRALALRHWPKCIHLKRVRDHGRAEALLLALWFIERERHGAAT